MEMSELFLTFAMFWKIFKFVLDEIDLYVFDNLLDSIHLYGVFEPTLLRKYHVYTSAMLTPFLFNFWFNEHRQALVTLLEIRWSQESSTCCVFDVICVSLYFGL